MSEDNKTKNKVIATVTPASEAFINILKGLNAGLESELGETSERPSEQELIFRLKEFYTFGYAIARLSKSMIETTNKKMDNLKDKKIKSKMLYPAMNSAYEKWHEGVVKILSLYETNQYFIYDDKDLLNRFTGDDLYKVRKKDVKEYFTDEVLAELRERQKALRNIISELENSTEKLSSDNSLVQKHKEQGLINATLDLSDNHPVVTLTDTGESYTLNKRFSQEEDPYKIIKWYLKNKGDYNGFIQNSRIKRELSLKYGINDTLRKSVLSTTAALSPFISNDDTTKKLRVILETRLTRQQLEAIKAVSSYSPKSE